MITVTFDSNTYRTVIEPGKYPNDPISSTLYDINAALKNRQISGFLSETLATLEGIQKVQRGPYFSRIRPKVSFHEKLKTDGAIEIQMSMGTEHSLHPGLHPIVAEWISKALGLGFLFLRVPRIGIPRPDKLAKHTFRQEADSEQNERLERFGEIEREINDRGLGISKIKTLGENINKRLGIKEPWFYSLDRANGLDEKNKIIKSIAEWADGDTAAAHYSYGINYLCSEDFGKSSGESIFSNKNREWLNNEYNIRFISLSGLSELLSANKK